MKRVRFTICSLAVACLGIAQMFPQTPTRRVYTYLWQPRQADVGQVGDSARRLLVAILKLSKPVVYTAEDGDSIDFIIRKHYYVSQGDFPNAFDLYQRRIWDLNPGLNSKSVLHAGQRLTLPGAPQYSAVRLWEPGTKPSPSYFRQLSAQAFDSNSASESHLRPMVTRTLKAFVGRAPSAFQADVYQRIQASGILRAIDTGAHPESELAQGQPIDLYPTTGTEALLDDVRVVDGSHLYRGLFPMATPLAVSCSGCKTCLEVLGASANTPLSPARVLIEDAGVDLGLMSTDNLQGMIITQPVTQTYPSQASAQDVTSDHHGTFVYSQLVKPTTTTETALQGMIPGNQVFVSRVARTIDAAGTQYYAMSDILAQWKEFEKRVSDGNSSISKGAAQTWVVNMSLFGEDTDSSDATPAPPKSDHLLFVVAAGNGKSNTDSALYAFSRFTGPGNAVLSVGALGANGSRASYSNYDAVTVSLAARGDCVCGAPGQINGTSQATPVVTTAAAILASRFPTLKPLEVLWRLVSSADRQPPANTTESFGGILNLKSALDTNIILSEDSISGTIKYHEVSDMVLPADLASESPGKELLRISRASGVMGSMGCFDLIHILSGLEQSCPSSRNTDVVSYTENGSSESIPLRNIVDIILPLPAWRDQTTTFPEVQIAN